MNTKILAVLFTLLFAGSAIAAQPGTAQENVINGVITDNSGPNGDDVLQSEWETRRESHQLWLRDRDGTSLRYNFCSGGSSNPNRCMDINHDLYNVLDPILGQGDANLGTPAVFTYGTTTIDTELHQLDAKLYINAMGVLSSLAPTVNVRLLADGTAIPGAEATIDLSADLLPNVEDPIIFGTLISEATGYEVSEVFSTPVVIPGGVELSLEVSANPGTIPGSITLSYDRADDFVGGGAAQSYIRLVADSAHFQVWTENSLRQEQNVFPLPANAPTDDRTVRVAFAQVAGLGSRALSEQEHTVQVRGATTDNLYFQRGGANDGITPWGYPTHSPGDITSGGDGILLTYYQLTYPSNMVETGEFDIRFYNNAGGWDVIKTINIGGGSFGLALLATEPASKVVFLENPSTFRFKATNLGTVIDDAVLSIGSSNQAWDVEISPSSLLENMKPGEEREIIVTVTPPSGVVAGERLFLNLSAQSIISTQIQKVSFAVATTDVAEYGLSLIGAIRDIEISPSETRTFPITIRNDGNDKDRFVVAASGAPAGWRTTVSPSVIDIPAQSQAPVFVTLTAPANVARGDEFDLRVTARRADDFAVSASRIIPVDVFKIDDFAFLLEDASTDGVMQYITSTAAATPHVQSLRDEGPDAAAGGTLWDGNEGPDRDFDSSAIFKLVFANPGDTDDIISFTPEWGDLPVAIDIRNVNNNGDECDGAGHPDGWRVRVWQDGDPVPASFQQVNDGSFRALGFDVPVPAKEERNVFIEARWQSPSGADCNASGHGTGTGAREHNPGAYAPIQVEAYSQNNPVNRFVHHLRANHDAHGGRESENFYGNAQRDVSIQHGGIKLDRAGEATVAVDGTTAQRTTKIPVLIANHGNEMDTVRVSIPTTSRGWTMSIEDINEDTVFGNDISSSSPPGGVSGRTGGCTTPVAESGFDVMECTMGIGDQARFNVKATAGNSVQIGDELDFKVDAISVDSLVDGKAGSIRDSFDIHLEATGTFVMDLLPNPSIGRLEYDVEPGEQLIVPVSLENSGTNDDEYAWAFSSEPQSQAWSATLSHGGFMPVPAGFTQYGFATIFVPPTANVGDQVGYTLAAQGTGGTDTLNIQLKVVQANTALQLDTIPRDVVASFDATQTVEFNLTRLSGSAGSASVRVIGTLPQELGIQNMDRTVGFNSDNYAVGSLDFVTGTALGTSRIPVVLEATDTEQNKARGYYIVNFASDTIGFDATGPENATTIVPGGSATATIELENLGLSSDLVFASVASKPAGWGASFEQDLIGLSPLGDGEATVSVFAASTAVRGTSHQVSLLFESTSDSLITQRVDVPFTVGIAELNVSSAEDVQFIAPTETIQLAASVANIGDVRDSVQISARVPQELQSLVKVDVSRMEAQLDPEQGESFAVSVTAPGNLAGGTRIPVTIKANSTDPLLQGLDEFVVEFEILHHRALDVDLDGFLEYAVDRNQNLNDGFEEYLEPVELAGINTTAPDMTRFLSAAAIEAKTVVEIINNETVSRLDFFIDGDKDGRADLFIDINGDLLPDLFWAPARGNVHAWQLSKDINGDGIPEAFIDVDGNGLLDVTYDFANGVFSDLLKIDVDADNQIDYVIDENGNGKADPGETVLFGEQGRVRTILEFRDVDGDGKEDAVYDEEGDGIPDYFVLDGTDVGIKIILRDVTGDGILDWTYDADGDGTPDSYFDPAKQESGLIDTTANFGRLVEQYWYVGAMFLLVAVLFAVLLVVTRRK